MTKNKNLREEVRKVVTHTNPDGKLSIRYVGDKEIDALLNLFQTWALELGREVREKKFPRGMREWCEECAERITAFQKKRIEVE